MIVRRTALAVALALLAAAAALLLWPLDANGVTGSAARPHYSDFGWESYVALPTHPTHADFRRAGITLPQDVVHDRRTTAVALAASGAVLLLGLGVGVGRRRLRTTTSGSSDI